MRGIPLLAAVALATFPGGSARAADGGGEATVIVDGFPATMVSEVLVPVPGEVFSVLDKLGDPKWSSCFWEGNLQRPAEREGLALYFGAVVAEGLIAVQAEDKGRVAEVGREVLRSASGLGVRDAVERHTQAVLAAAEGGRWDEVGAELDRTLETVGAELEQLQDSDLAQLVSLGGWIRGTAAAAHVIAEDYAAERAELLRQPEVVAHFRELADRMAEGRDGREGHPVVKSIAIGLSELHRVYEGGRKPAAAGVEGMGIGTVYVIGELCGGLVEVIFSNAR